ncbi:hypothetical protein ACGFZL_20535 [Streptomyces sp. NPDC048182]|uniref:hypothetical protein n=1 Tax=Streptomyces sp. NPDC048182 TaxID=3365507 RepID=UPI003716A9A9
MDANRSRTRRWALKQGAVGGVLALACGGLFAGASEAGATGGPVDIDCLVGSQTTSYAPAKTNTPRPTTITTDEHFTCTSLLSGISSGTSRRVSNQEVGGCLLSGRPPFDPQTVKYTWNTGQTSTVTYTVDAVETAAGGTFVVTKTGTVSAGLDSGRLATEVVVVPALDLTACLTTGITSQTGPATLEIAPV